MRETTHLAILPNQQSGVRGHTHDSVMFTPTRVAIAIPYPVSLCFLEAPLMVVMVTLPLSEDIEEEVSLFLECMERPHCGEVLTAVLVLSEWDTRGHRGVASTVGGLRGREPQRINNSHSLV